jgi:hypothetical protein
MKSKSRIAEHFCPAMRLVFILFYFTGKILAYPAKIPESE